jgi:2-keto-4-pentenoate hydratase/2-oxohepta-3-ene-1,7-dioic acid hydratase in catechol pathway
MFIASIREDNADKPVFVHAEKGVLRPQALDPNFDGDAMELLSRDMDTDLHRQASRVPDYQFEPVSRFTFAAPYHSPRKIWGIGLNYVDHAGDLNETVPTEPASFIKADHTIIGPGEPILIPEQSSRVTAEAELGIIIGRTARNVSEEDALGYVWGLCTILDQTAEDILRRNPRFLTRAKNFPTFFSFGPYLVPMDEVMPTFSSLGKISVSTMLNHREERTNVVANMTFSPEYLVSFHSHVMPLFPGDIISTGTPGAVVVADGDIVACSIPGVGYLTNPVRSAQR